MSLDAEIPFREVPYLPVRLRVDRDDRGQIYLTNENPLRPGPSHMLAPVIYWAATAPDRLWLAQRDPVDPGASGWQRLSYGEGLKRVRAIAAGLLELGLRPGRPLMILSRNSIEHALVMYAALMIGAPVCPVTPVGPRTQAHPERLAAADALVSPAAFFVEEAADYAHAAGVLGTDRPVIAARGAGASHSLAALEAVKPDGKVDLGHDAVAPDTHAKYLLTSGSTGHPKAVVLTHGNIATNVKMIRSVWDVERLEEISGQQVMCSFLPWSHSLGANAILHSMTDWGGALYIDWGAPQPGKVETMVANLRDVAVTQHTTVPAAWAALATALETDRAMAENFFSRLLVMSYGGAAMGQDLYERIQRVAVEVTGERISLSAGYGATETTPTASNVHWPNDTMGLLGLPVPGSRFKLAPVAGKMELRCKGPHIMAGYLNDPERTAAAFDEDGWLKLGDAVRFADPEQPEKGLAFDGRLAEEFKLANGSWVSCGMVRQAAVSACDGLLSDVVVCGESRDAIALIGFPDWACCRERLGASVQTSADEALRQAVGEALQAYNRSHNQPTRRIGRILLDDVPPDPSLGEITEKGYLNQVRLRETRADLVARLYSGAADEDFVMFRAKA